MSASNDGKTRLSYQTKSMVEELKKRGFDYVVNPTGSPRFVFPLLAIGNVSIGDDKSLFVIQIGNKIPRIELVEKEKVKKTIELCNVAEVRDVVNNGFSLVYGMKVKGQQKGFLGSYTFQSKRDAEDLIYFFTVLTQNNRKVEPKNSQLVLHQGPAAKKGKTGKYAERYLRLVNNNLLVYRYEKSEWPVNVFSLDGALLVSPSQPPVFSLFVPETNRTVTFKSKSPALCNKWVDALSQEGTGAYDQLMVDIIGEIKQVPEDELTPREKFYADKLIAGLRFNRYDETSGEIISDVWVHTSPDLQNVLWGDEQQCAAGAVHSISKGRETANFKAFDAKASSAIYPKHCFSLGVPGDTVDLEVGLASLNPQKEAVTMYNAFQWLVHITSTLRLLGYQDRHDEYQVKIKKHLSTGDVSERAQEAMQKAAKDKAEEAVREKAVFEEREVARKKREAEDTERRTKETQELAAANGDVSAMAASVDVKTGQIAPKITFELKNAQGVYNVPGAVTAGSLMAKARLKWSVRPVARPYLMYAVSEGKKLANDKLLFGIMLSSPVRIDLIHKEVVKSTIPLSKVQKCTALSDRTVELVYSQGTSGQVDKTVTKHYTFGSTMDCESVCFVADFYRRKADQRFANGQLVFHEGALDKQGKSGSWAERYVRLVSNNMLIYRNESSEFPVNVVALESAKIKGPKDPAVMGFQVGFNGVLFGFRCPNQQAFQAWSEALKFERTTKELRQGAKLLSGEGGPAVNSAVMTKAIRVFIEELGQKRNFTVYAQDQVPCTVPVHWSSALQYIQCGGSREALSDLTQVVDGRKSAGFKAYDEANGGGDQEAKGLNSFTVYFSNGREFNLEAATPDDALLWINIFTWLTYVFGTIVRSEDSYVHNDTVEKIRAVMRGDHVKDDDEVVDEGKEEITRGYVAPEHRNSNAPPMLSNNATTPPMLSGRTSNAAPPMLSGRTSNAAPPMLSGRTSNAAPPMLSGRTSNAAPPMLSAPVKPVVAPVKPAKPTPAPAEPTPAPIEEAKSARLPDTTSVQEMFGKISEQFKGKDFSAFADAFEGEMYDTVGAFREDTEWHAMQAQLKIPLKLMAKIKAIIE